jgi:hypothetical protein
MRELTPREIEYTVWDHEIHGFGVRVRRTGYKSFVLFYRARPKGRLRKITLDTAIFSLDQARELAKEFLQEQSRLKLLKGVE